MDFEPIPQDEYNQFECQSCGDYSPDEGICYGCKETKI